MSYATAGLVEIYAMKKIYEEEGKKSMMKNVAEAQKRKSPGNVSSEKKKVHPVAAVPSSLNSSTK